MPSQEGFNEDNPYGSNSVVVSTQPGEGMEEVKKAEANQPDNTDDTSNEDNGDDNEENNNVPSMPEGGSEKFYNAETGEYNWEAHAREAEFKAAQAAKKAPKQKAEDQGADDEGGDEGAKNAVEDAGLDWNGLGEKLQSKGDIDDADYEALEKAGIPRDVAEQYVNGFNTQAAQAADQAKSYIQEALDADDADEATEELMSWAGENLDDEDIDAYNEMLQTPQWKVALDSLTARYNVAQQSKGPSRLRGQSSSGKSADTFNNQQEIIDAMKDERYKPQSAKFDPKYRQQVLEKLQRSDVGF